MSKSDTPKEVLQERLEKLLERVRKMKPGGDLDGLLNEEIEDLSRIVREEAAKERAITQHQLETHNGLPAAFPPSSKMPKMRKRSDARRGKKKSKDS